ncbi:MAG: SDR family oxidoreductase [Erysipelotrichaceae bacterium]|nr:SDR family oxidoreductase [Erysipelotrichaceae bacterium]
MILEGKAGIVTGGCSGIGEAIVKAFVEEGAQVVVADWNDQGNDIVENMGFGDNVRFIKTDVSSEDDIIKMVEFAVESFGHIDIAVACAGVAGDKTIVDQQLDKWHKILSVDLDGVFLTDKHVINHMLENNIKGSIINLSSIGGLVGFPHDVTYSAAKGAVVNLTRSAANKVADKAIRVNAIAPGYIHTPMMDAIPNQEDLAIAAKLHPMQRMGYPEEVANACVFLASDKASFITGVTLPVDGGYTAQ